MDKLLHVVLVDDDEDEYFLLKEMILGAPREGALRNLKLDWISNYDDAVSAFRECRYDLYLVDYYMGSNTGLDFLNDATDSRCKSPIILLTGQGRYDIDMAAMQLGASDYLVKGEVSYSLLERTIRYAMERIQSREYLANLLQDRTRDLNLLEKHTKELNELHNATTNLLNTLDLNILMGQILDSAQGAVSAADRSWLHLTDQPESNLHKLSSTQFRDERIHKIDWSMNQEHPLFCVYEGKPLLIDDIKTGMLNFPESQDENSSIPIRSLISAPLALEQECFGALSLSAAHARVFEIDDLQLLTSFANTATAAIRNAILHAEVESLATLDPLTGQLNRRALFEQGQKDLEQFQRLGQPFSLIMFDIDNFKIINDTYGHEVGDKVLTTVVERCVNSIRHVDILGRYGGDEFVVILPGAGSNMVISIAERIRCSMCETPIETGAAQVMVSVSLGVAQATAEIESLSTLIRCADEALYRAKHNGRNCVRTAEPFPCQEE